MKMMIKETTVCQVRPLDFTCDHMGSTIEGISILKPPVLFFDLKNKGKVTSDLPHSETSLLTVAMQMVTGS